MRLRLSDGTYIDASMLKATSKSSSRRRENAPSKRQVKVGGGALKRWHSRQTGTNVGGTNNIARATYRAFIEEVDEDGNKTGEVVIDRLGVETCKVVDASKRKFTWDLGGSTPSPYRGGKGL